MAPRLVPGTRVRVRAIQPFGGAARLNGFLQWPIAAACLEVVAAENEEACQLAKTS